MQMLESMVNRNTGINCMFLIEKKGGHNMKEKQQREQYEKPTVEIIDFTIEESIATSLDFGPSTLCGEEMW